MERYRTIDQLIDSRRAAFHLALFKPIKDRVRLFKVFGDHTTAPDIKGDEAGTHIQKAVDVGYHPTKKYLYIADGLPTLEHEVAHMVEIQERRILLPDWGLRIYSKIQNETPSSLVAGAAREIRVRAIEDVLSGAKNDHKTRLMQNSIWRDALVGIIPYGRFKSEKDLEDWSSDLHTRTYNTWSKDRIYSEWHRRLAIVKNWMETN